MPSSITRVFILLLSALILLPSLSWAEDDEAATPAIYYQFPKPITINFLNQSNQDVRYLQIKVTLMSHDQEIIDSATLNLPMLEDALRTLFSEQTMASVNSVKGRKALKDTTLNTIKAILKEETGKNNIEGLYFTSFILQ
ncbi:MAG: flagellar basal body-associated FliL family protein [Piscirickettsiaceae bacterium]|nr:flagellar basal body-associated FliL family protein [Piscirickettsiaceae bacterium]